MSKNNESTSYESMSNSESYPPEFRTLMSEPTEPEKSTEPGLDRSKDIDIPVIDMEHLDMEKLREACKDWGIFHLENTGIPLTLMSQVKEITESVLSLPFEEKRTLFGVNSPLSYYWGTHTVSPSGKAVTRAPQESSGHLFEGINVPLSSLSSLLPLSCSDPKLESFRYDIVLLNSLLLHSYTLTSLMVFFLVGLMNQSNQKSSLHR